MSMRWAILADLNGEPRHVNLAHAFSVFMDDLAGGTCILATGGARAWVKESVTDVSALMGPSYIAQSVPHD